MTEYIGAVGALLTGATAFGMFSVAAVQWRGKDVNTRLAVSQVSSGFSALVACLAYIGIAAGYETIELPGGPFIIARWLDWLFSTPFLMLSVMQLLGADGPRMFLVIWADVFMIVSGAMAAMATALFAKVLFFVVGTSMFVVMGLGVSSAVERAQARQSPQSLDSVDESLVLIGRKLAVLTFCTWSFYPLVTLLGPEFTDTLSSAGLGASAIVLDFIAKVVFSAVIAFSRVQLAVGPKGTGSVREFLDRISPSSRRGSKVTIYRPGDPTPIDRKSVV